MKKARCRSDTGPFASSKSRPSVISAYFRRRALHRVVHLPTRQMRYVPETNLSAVSLRPAATETRRLVLNASFQSPLSQRSPNHGAMLCGSVYKSTKSAVGSCKILKKSSEKLSRMQCLGAPSKACPGVSVGAHHLPAAVLSMEGGLFICRFGAIDLAWVWAHVRRQSRFANGMSGRLRFDFR